VRLLAETVASLRQALCMACSTMLARYGSGLRTVRRATVTSAAITVALVVGVPSAEASWQASPILRVSASHVGSHSAVLEADLSPEARIEAQYNFSLRYTPCRTCAVVGEAEAGNGWLTPGGVAQHVRSEIVGLPANTSQSFSISVRVIIRQLSPPYPCADLCFPPVVKSDVTSGEMSFVTEREDPARERREARALAHAIAQTQRHLTSTINADFGSAKHGAKSAYHLLGTHLYKRLVQYRVASSNGEELGHIAFELTYATVPAMKLRSIEIDDETAPKQSVAFPEASPLVDFGYEAERVSAGRWSIRGRWCAPTLKAPSTICKSSPAPSEDGRFSPAEVRAYEHDAREVLSAFGQHTLPGPFFSQELPSPVWIPGDYVRPL
jgi:hypothetical protein